jgi:tricorn protease
MSSRPSRLIPSVLLALCAVAATAAEPTLLLRDPTVSATRIVFVYAGDLWSVDRDGGDVMRLTADPAPDLAPAFSPDGTRIAFTREHGDNLEVYVMPAGGGAPKRLTWHPGADRVTGWSADGARIAFASRREASPTGELQLWEVAPEGGAPRKVMDADFFQGRWNGATLAYVPFIPAYSGMVGGNAGWKGYRGGLAPAVHLIDPARGTLEVIPGERASHLDPLWVGGALYFVADREDAAFNLYAWDAASRSARRVTDERPWDVRAADAFGDRIVYEAGGRLKELDTTRGTVREIVVRIDAELPEARAQWKSAGAGFEAFDVSPSGKRVLLTSRGEVFSVPVKDGAVRNLSHSAQAREYGALWSPKGDRVAWVVQRDADQALAVRDQGGLEAAVVHPLGEGFHQLLAFAPDGGRIAYANERLELWVVRLSDGRRTRIDTEYRRNGFRVAFSPDSRWLAYTLNRPNFLSDLMLRDLEGTRSVRLTDGMADVTEAAFSPDGKYLYFAASTNAGPAKVSLDLSSQEQNERRAFYAVVLSSEGESPLAPRTADEGEDDESSEDEAGDDADSGDDAEPVEPTRIDLEGIGRRVVAIPLAERNYRALAVVADGDLLFIDAVQPGASAPPDGESEEAGNRLRRYDFEAREATDVAEGVVDFVLAADGKHVVTRDSDDQLLAGELGDDETTLEALDVSGVGLMVDPRREWRQIFDDAVRMQRHYFYASNLHGVDWDAVAARYRPLLDHVGRRADLNDLIIELIAELRVGHNFVFGGDLPEAQGESPAGLLGADLRAENGRWKIARILDGGRWEPFQSAPLRRPGLDVAAGDYILAVNGVEVDAREDLHARLVGTVGAQTTLTVARDAAGKDRRNVVVEPIASERDLRLWDWIEARHARVQAASGGRVGYVYLPNTTTEGYRYFNRMFYAQVDKEGLVIDERANGGGQAANYITDVLGARPLAGWLDRAGAPYGTPGGAVHGPKVMLIDQYAGSGGDFLPYAFRREGLGKLIGTRTWGGLIGIYANPEFVDGGGMTVPFFRFFTPEGQWAIENEGVAPDIEVALDPVAFNRGEDSQLEVAIREVMRQLPATAKPLAAPPLPTEPGR